MGSWLNLQNLCKLCKMLYLNMRITIPQNKIGFTEPYLNFKHLKVIWRYGNLLVYCHEDNQNLFTNDKAFVLYQYHVITCDSIDCLRALETVISHLEWRIHSSDKKVLSVKLPEPKLTCLDALLIRFNLHLYLEYFYSKIN